MRCCQEASAAFVPAGLRGLAFPFAYASDSPTLASPLSEFHLHPHCRTQLPLEATLLKTQPGLDDFVTEKYQDQIAAILAEWSAAFDQSYMNLARVYALEGTPDKARSVLLNLLKQHPGHSAAQQALQQLY
jgi:hypothetical protein